jgi:hypothetical protein
MKMSVLKAGSCRSDRQQLIKTKIILAESSNMFVQCCGFVLLVGTDPL